MEEAKDVSCWKALVISILLYFVITFMLDKAIKIIRERRKQKEEGQMDQANKTLNFTLIILSVP